MNRNQNAPTRGRSRGANQNTRHINYSLNPLNTVLAAGENVRHAGNGYRLDCGNGHRSRGTLAIEEADNGDVLIFCHSGCSQLEAVHGLGLELHDLFARQDPATMTPQQRREHREKMRQSGWKTALELLPLEILIVQAASVDLLQGKALSEADHLRLELASKRISSAKAVLCGR